jgi:putative heme-binding domain-containing protein
LRPDGWLYGAQGSTVTARVRGVEFQQGVWRYHPVTHEFELFAEGGGNTWGIDFDAYGRLFAGGNTNEPLCHHVQGGYYLKWFGKHGGLHNPYAFGYFQPVQHVGFLGSALTGGFVIYQGGLFPDRFTDAVIYPNLRANAMRVSRLEPRGSTFTTHFQEDFVVSTDLWFRPVNNLVGPDGALYVADWCDSQIRHSDVKDHSKWYLPHDDAGRIWRVVPAGKDPRAIGPWPLAKRNSDGLVDLLGHPNAWYVREALRLLGERRDAAIRPRLERMVWEARDDRLALRALWALHGSGGLDERTARKLLDHPGEHIRAWTVRLLGDRRRVSPEIAARFLDLAGGDKSLTVLSQLACTCKRLPGQVGLPVVERLCGRADLADDPHIPLLLWWAVEDKATSDRELVLERFGSAGAWGMPVTRSVIVERLARRYLAEGKPETYAACARLLRAAPGAGERTRLIEAMDQQVQGTRFERPPPELAGVLRPLLREGVPDPALVRLGVRLGLPDAAPLAVARAGDAGLAPAERVGYIRCLGDARYRPALDALVKALGAREPPPVQDAALQALQGFDGPAVAEAVLKGYPTLSPPLRDRARDVLVSRPAWSARLVAAVEAGDVPARDVSVEQVRHLLLHRDAALGARVEKLWGKVRTQTSREKQGRIQAVAEVLSRGQGDAARGKQLVTKYCLVCHQLFGEGQRVGPDLTAADRKNLDVLLQNVIDPSAVIREGYQQYVVTLQDGRVLSGLVAESSPTTVTLVDAKNVRTVLQRKDIDEQTQADTSLMPEGLLDGLSDQEVRDLFQYLRSDPGH